MYYYELILRPTKSRFVIYRDDGTEFLVCEPTSSQEEPLRAAFPRSSVSHVAVTPDEAQQLEAILDQEIAVYLPGEWLAPGEAEALRKQRIHLTKELRWLVR